MAKPKLETIFIYGVDDDGEARTLQYEKKSGRLFISGEAIVTEKRFSNFERGLAVTGLVIAIAGVTASIVQAWAAVAALP
ncbi:hypothetical protein [Devosia sp. A449]